MELNGGQEHNHIWKDIRLPKWFQSVQYVGFP